MVHFYCFTCHHICDRIIIWVLLTKRKETNSIIMETATEVKAKKKPLTRFGEFELLKAIAILGLPAVHLLEEAVEGGFANPSLMKFGTFVIGLCAFGPSVFMICMGFGIGGGRNKPDGIMRNGIQFLLIGAILNVFRWLIPGIIQSIVVDKNIWDDVEFCLESDIYYFVGLFYIFYSILLRLKIQTPGLLLTSIVTLSLNTLLTPLTGAHITNPIVAALVGNIVYVNETSCFPLLSWAVFPTVGIILGEVLKKTNEEQRENIMKRVLDISGVLFFSFIVFLWTYHIDIEKALVSPANDYITDLPNVVLLISLALFAISIAYYLCKHIGASKFMEFMLRISAFIIPFYLAQWIIIAWIFYIMEIVDAPVECYTPLWYFGCVVVVTLICIFIAIKHGMKLMKVLLKITTIKTKKKKKDKKNEKK